MVPLKIPKEEKTLLVRDFQDYLDDTLDEPVGNLAAEIMLDFVLRLVAPYVYNQAIADARKVLQQQMMRADDELSYLEQPIDRRKRTMPSGEERE